MVKVLQTGLFTTVQDMGRLGFQEYGVPVSGVMDTYSAGIANAVLGNDKTAAVLEITMTGPRLQFNWDTCICISGANISPSINNSSIQLNRVIAIKKGDVLSFWKLQYGFRCYIAVSGGFQTEKSMHSRSMYPEITSEFRVKKEDELAILAKTTLEKPKASVKIKMSHFTSEELKVFKGPEFYLLTTAQQKQLVSGKFSISKENNRMAYQLFEPLKNSLKPILTSLVLPGTVQLTPSGKLIILMRDCQTTGGYPRVLQLSEAAINCIAQKVTGHSIFFRL